MSQLNLYIKQKGEMKGVLVPAYVARDLLVEGLPTEELSIWERRAKPATEMRLIDAGSLCIDFDRREIVSQQRSFNLTDLNGEFERQMKDWKFVDIISPESPL